jgi:hypothetical protein
VLAKSRVRSLRSPLRALDLAVLCAANEAVFFFFLFFSFFRFVFFGGPVGVNFGLL